MIYKFFDFVENSYIAVFLYHLFGLFQTSACVITIMIILKITLGLEGYSALFLSVPIVIAIQVFVTTKNHLRHYGRGYSNGVTDTINEAMKQLEQRGGVE